MPLTEMTKLKKLPLYIETSFNCLNDLKLIENKFFLFEVFILLSMLSPLGLCCLEWPQHLPRVSYATAGIQNIRTAE
jgi:hypothetical protein